VVVDVVAVVVVVVCRRDVHNMVEPATTTTTTALHRMERICVLCTVLLPSHGTALHCGVAQLEVAVQESIGCVSF
jgi:hypothetical protein